MVQIVGDHSGQHRLTEVYLAVLYTFSQSNRVLGLWRGANRTKVYSTLLSVMETATLSTSSSRETNVLCSRRLFHIQKATKMSANRIALKAEGSL